MSAPQNLAEVCDDDRFARIEELADEAASFWRSIAEAAYRGLDQDHPRNLTRSVILPAGRMTS